MTATTRWGPEVISSDRKDSSWEFLIIPGALQVDICYQLFTKHSYQCSTSQQHAAGWAESMPFMGGSRWPPPPWRGTEMHYPLSNYAPPTAQGLILLLVPNLWEARQKQNCHQTTGSAAAKSTSEEPRRFHAPLEENIRLRTHSRPVTWAHNADYPPPQQSLQGPLCRWPSTLAPRPHLPGGGRKLTFYF